MTIKYLPRIHWCSIWGHRFQPVKKINAHFQEFECLHCKTQATNNHLGQKIKLTASLKEINDTLLYLHVKKEFLQRFYFNKKS